MEPQDTSRQRLEKACPAREDIKPKRASGGHVVAVRPSDIVTVAQQIAKPTRVVSDLLQGSSHPAAVEAEEDESRGVVHIEAADLRHLLDQLPALA